MTANDLLEIIHVDEEISINGMGYDMYDKHSIPSEDLLKEVKHVTTYIEEGFYGHHSATIVIETMEGK